jgi:transcriptional regulator of acetoin/glycerol metabolism
VVDAAAGSRLRHGDAPAGVYVREEDPPLTALTHARRALDVAWSSFVIDGRLPDSVRPEILRSWQRATSEWHIDPTQRSARSAASDAFRARSDTEDALLVASPLVTGFAKDLGRDGHVVALCDANGVVLDLQGNARTREQVQEFNLAPGACWGEDSAGTNGIGTAIVERHPVEVFASEHFVEAWHAWNCASAPVVVAGRLVGVVDITSPWTNRNPSLLVCAEALASAMEGRLDALAAQRGEILRRALFERGGSSGWFAVDLHGTVVGTGPAARLSGLEPDALTAGALAPLLTRLRDRAEKGDFEQVLDVAGRAVRVICGPIDLAGRKVGAFVRVVLAPPPRRRGAPGPPARPRYSFDDILGDAPTLARQVSLARVAARSLLPVLILGESGTGKELFAQAIHAAGERAGGPFVALNCGAIPQSLVEAELLGYEPGSFTGGRAEGRRGRVEDADGGTLFLDELSELSAPGQLALLRVLQEHEVTRLGSSAPRPVEVRVIAATNRDLRMEILAGRFRQDLYYRLNVLGLDLPPLRDRPEDVPRLAELCLAQAQVQARRGGLTISREALAALVAYRWPGNVRELKNVIERAAAVAPGHEILPSDLPPVVLESASAPPGKEVTRPLPAAAVRPDVPSPPGDERALLAQALERSSWNVVLAARSLGISRRTMYRRLRRHGLARHGGS